MHNIYFATWQKGINAKKSHRWWFSVSFLYNQIKLLSVFSSRFLNSSPFIISCWQFPWSSVSSATQALKTLCALLHGSDFIPNFYETLFFPVLPSLLWLEDAIHCEFSPPAASAPDPVPVPLPSCGGGRDSGYFTVLRKQKLTGFELG